MKKSNAFLYLFLLYIHNPHVISLVSVQPSHWRIISELIFGDLCASLQVKHAADPSISLVTYTLFWHTSISKPMGLSILIVVQDWIVLLTVGLHKVWEDLSGTYSQINICQACEWPFLTCIQQIKIAPLLYTVCTYTSLAAIHTFLVLNWSKQSACAALGFCGYLFPRLLKFYMRF